jgi:nitroimidazol reductase NimA-like FMN-containing flavoprotein (pyridoxamine 5'-phosphate oxidase superfamily)
MHSKLPGYIMENLLKRKSYARIGCCAEGSTHSLEIDFAYSDEAAYCCLKNEEQLALLWENPKVCLGVSDAENTDNYKYVVAWCVIEKVNNAMEASKARRALFVKTGMALDIGKTFIRVYIHEKNGWFNNN